jgi:hypothetical protein
VSLPEWVLWGAITVNLIGCCAFFYAARVSRQACRLYLDLAQRLRAELEQVRKEKR